MSIRLSGPPPVICPLSFEIYQDLGHLFDVATPVASNQLTQN